MPLGRKMAQVLSNPLSTRYAQSLTFLLDLSPQRTFPLTIEDGCQNNHTFLSFRNSQQATSRSTVVAVGNGRLRSLALQ